MCVFVCNPCVCLCAIRVCVWPGVPKVSYFTVSGAPGVRHKANIFIGAGVPIHKKIDFRSRYVCVFVHVLMAKTTIGKSMCVFVCNPCVCLCGLLGGHSVRILMGKTQIAPHATFEFCSFV